jgi:hypothetical protein
MKLIDNWRDSWRFASVRLLAAIVLIQSNWDAMPEELKSLIPGVTLNRVTVGLAILAYFGRLVKQTIPEKK